MFGTAPLILPENQELGAVPNRVLVWHYRCYGYSLAQELEPSGHLVLSHQCQEGKVCTLRVRDQAKQAAHSGPPFSIDYPRGSHLATLASEQESSHRTPDRSQVPLADPPAAPDCTTRTRGKTRKKTCPMRGKHSKNWHKTKGQFYQHNCI
jgi:hypothetical protein